MKIRTVSIQCDQLFGSFVEDDNISLISGADKCLNVLYRIGYMRTWSEDASLAKNVVRVAKFFCPFLLVPPGCKEDTSCILKIETLSIHDNQARLKYDISVCNGGGLHRTMVRKLELARLRLLFPIWFSVSGAFIDVDLSACPFFAETGITRIKDITFKGRACLITYE